MMNNKHLGKRIFSMLGIVIFAFALITACSSDDDEGGNNGGGAVPTISDFSPKEGEAGISVTITGANLSGATQATVNGVNATITANTATSVTITIPDGATSGEIIVATPGGAAKTTESFTVIVIGAATITDISPKSAKAGDVVTITGTDMQTVSAAKVGGVDAAVEVVSDTEIKLTIGDSPTGLSVLEITNDGGVLTTDPASEEFYVYSLISVDDPEDPFRYNEDFEGERDGLTFTTGSDAENIPEQSGWSPDVADFPLKPAPIDGNFYILGGVSDITDSGSYAGQIGNSEVDPGTFSAFFAGANAALDTYYFNIQMNFQGIPADYPADDVLGGLRVRFDVPGIDIDMDGSSTDQLMEYRPSLQDLMDKGFVADANGWYSISIPFDAFLNPGESGATWSDYNVEQNVTRFAVAARREHDGNFSMSIDNISISKGGPVYFSNN